MEKVLRYEKVRFLMTGFFNTGLDFVLLNILVFLLGAYPLIANTITVLIGITISYILNHHFVFRNKSKLSFRKYAAFLAVTGFSSLVIQNTIIYSFELAGASGFLFSIPPVELVLGNEALRLNVAKACAVLVGMVWNFTLYKFVIFRKKHNIEANSEGEQKE